jgi:hypothetical protein
MAATTVAPATTAIFCNLFATASNNKKCDVSGV